MGRTSPQNAATDWHETAIRRARNVWSRLLYSSLIAIAGVWLGEGSWPAYWFAATVLSQLVTILVLEPVRRDPAFPVSDRRRMAFHATLALGSVVFTSCGPFLWFQGGSGGRLFAVIVLSGAMVNAAMQAGDSFLQLWVVYAPMMAALQVLPILSLLTATAPERRVLAFTTFGAMLVTLHLSIAGRRSVMTARQVKAALASANRERARAEAASAAKSDFLGVMSHELRTPLNGVLGMAQVMAAGTLEPAQRTRLEVVRQSGEHLLVLLNDLLDIAELDTEQLQIEAGVVEVDAMAAQTEALFAPLAAAKAIGFSLTLEPSAGAARAGDPIRVRQVLHNLVGAAVRSTEAGAVTVRIKGDADTLIFEVADTGPGLGPDGLATVFDRVAHGDERMARAARGPGLGLAIARGLAELMGGEVTARSAPAEGAVFTARLGLARVAPSAPAREEPAAAPAGGALRVLAAEDNPTNQLVLKTLLAQAGMEVHLVSDGQAAVTAWRGGRWDVVLMDLQMPVMDGLAATRAIRELEASEGRARTPIVAVTANAAAERAAEYLEAGLDGVVPKPIQFAQLLAAMGAALDAVRAPEEAQRSAA
jgi:signal transduction histidine kinase/AmiR/NasT family two-component response regulator